MEKKAEKSSETARQAPRKPKADHNKQPDGEKGGFEKLPEPTRFGDWEVDGRCSDF